jgi:hypothetical protein
MRPRRDGNNNGHGQPPRGGGNDIGGGNQNHNNDNNSDADADGKIDTMLVTFSEPITDGSWLSSNDLVFSNVGDFTTAAFGASLTDRAVGTISSYSFLGLRFSVVSLCNSSFSFFSFSFFSFE